MNDLDFTRRVYREFSSSPLSPEQHDLYVDLDAVRGGMDAVARLEARIRLAEEGLPTCQVLAGHNGSGKSTELFRLQKMLEDGDESFFVVRLTAAEIDLNDVDFPDILIAVIQQLAVQLKNRENIHLKQRFFRQIFASLKKILTSINFDKLELGVALLKISGTIKGSPDARAKIRKLLEPDTGNLLKAANEVIGEAIGELSKKGNQGLVILVDDLDKMVVRPRNDSSNTDDYLFVNRAAQLTAFMCHVVYTIPISLAYSHHEPTIKRSYGDDVPVIPMTKIVERPPKQGPHCAGMEKFRQIIASRLKKAGVEESEVFTRVFTSADVRDDLISLSGGQPTELMALVREAIVTHGLPIDEKSVRRAAAEGRREYARQLREDHWPVIEEVRKTGEYARTNETEAVFRELLNSRAILQYVNDAEWYGLNPMVADIEPPGKRKPDR